jgi:hypothetical protein
MDVGHAGSGAEHDHKQEDNLYTFSAQIRLRWPLVRQRIRRQCLGPVVRPANQVEYTKGYNSNNTWGQAPSVGKSGRGHLALPVSLVVVNPGENKGQCR